jgi:hypothetical protein
MVLSDELIDTHDELDRFKAISEASISELSGATININNFINSFRNEGNIDEKVNALFGDNASVLLREFILSVLEGIDGEIRLVRGEDGTVKFGFADNAIFGPIDEE